LPVAAATRDLQARGVLCWFAVENLTIGDAFRPTIDETIRGYDKLLVFHSESLVPSILVEKELECASKKENQQIRLVLLPIRLDGTVMKNDVGCAAPAASATSAPSAPTARTIPAPPASSGIAAK
jgi:hypothetical protein